MKVIEVCQVMAGPFCGCLLADMGADVMKVENPDGGDTARDMGRYFDGGEVWMADYFDGTDKNLVVSTLGTAGEVNGLEDVYLAKGDWLPTFMGGGNFPWGGDKNKNIEKFFSTYRRS